MRPLFVGAGAIIVTQAPPFDQWGWPRIGFR